MSFITGSRHNCEQGQPAHHNNETTGGAGKGTTTGPTPQGGGGDTTGWGGEEGCGSPASYMCVCLYGACSRWLETPCSPPFVRRFHTMDLDSFRRGIKDEFLLSFSSPYSAQGFGHRNFGGFASFAGVVCVHALQACSDTPMFCMQEQVHFDSKQVW